MLEIKEVTKIYEMDEVKQIALDKVSINFRKNEFVSILGQSGSGKSTLLNIIGGLDSYTSGDLIISGISTKKYQASDRDTYRNHKVGVVFQSYNLIMHQTILSNVELALTLSGESKEVAKEKLVIMVTHNPELAKEYSTRIVSLKDGHIIDDTMPFDGKEENAKEENKKIKSMGSPTALSLSLNNLLTKKGRTLVTAIANCCN